MRCVVVVVVAVVVLEVLIALRVLVVLAVLLVLRVRVALVVQYRWARILRGSCWAPARLLPDALRCMCILVLVSGG